MRLKTVATEEAPTTYRALPTSEAIKTEAHEQPIGSTEESQTSERLTTSRRPLAHPQRVASLCASFLLVLGVFHALSANNPPTVPSAHVTERGAAVQALERLPQAAEYFSAANSLVSRELYRCETLAQKQQALKDNATALALGHEALTKSFDRSLRHFNGASALGELFAMEYEVRRAEGKREAALKALLARIRLESTSLKSPRFTPYYNLANFNHSFEKYLNEDRFTPAEVKTIQAALQEFTKSSPDWETLANAQEAQALEEVRAVLTGTISRNLDWMASERTVANWTTLANGNLLQSAQAKLALQSAILRYGAQGLVDIYVPYIEALRLRALASPSEAARITLPSIPNLPQNAEIGRGLIWLGEQRKAWEATCARLNSLRFKGTG